MPPEIHPKTDLALAIYSRMRELDMSVKDLAGQLEVVYETIRQIAAGDRPPSKRLLRDICTALRLDFKRLDLLLANQKLKKLGGVPVELSARNPELSRIEAQWQFLTSQQKDHVNWLVDSFAQKNAVASKPPRHLKGKPI